MNYLPVSILSYFLNSLAVLVDKALLTKDIKNPLIYIFYITLFSFLVFLVLPFTSTPTLLVFILASIAGITWTAGVYYMYKALQLGQASRVVPVINTLNPVLLLIYYAILTKSITQTEIWAVLFLILGIIILAFPYFKGKFYLKEASFELVASFLIVISYIVLKEAYLRSSFLTGFVYSKVILVPIALTILAVPMLRQLVLSSHGPRINFKSKVGAVFLSGQAAGGASELLLNYAIFLASPAVVNAIQGTQYVFLLIFSLILGKKFPESYQESYDFFNILGKVAGISAVAVGLYILAFSPREIL